MYTQDELWTINLPKGWLNGYLQLDSQVHLNGEGEDLDSEDEIALQVQKQYDVPSENDRESSDDDY